MVDEARARFHLNDLKAARDIAERVLRGKPRWLTAQTTLTASLWNLAEYDDARAIARSILAGHPHFSVRRWGRGLPYRYDEHLDALLEPLRLAGLPD
jgi:adenylate cyclase